MMNNKTHTVSGKGARGTKKLVSTGMDKSSMGGTGTSSLKPSMKGGVHDASSSIAGASTRKI